MQHEEANLALMFVSMIQRLSDDFLTRAHSFPTQVPITPGGNEPTWWVHVSAAVKRPQLCHGCIDQSEQPNATCTRHRQQLVHSRISIPATGLCTNTVAKPFYS